MLTRILCLKMVLPYTWVLYFELFCFQDILCALSTIRYRLIRHREISLYWLFQHRNCLVLTLMDEERCCRTMKTDFPDLWNNENLDFPTFSGSLFAENHWFILINSSLTVIKKCVYVAVLKKKSNKKTTKNKTKQNKTKKKK